MTAFPLSLFAWFKTASATNQALVALSHNGAPEEYSLLYVNTSGAVAVQQFASPDFPTATVGTTAGDGTWHAAGGVCTSTTSRKAYLDGVGGTVNTGSVGAAAVTANDTTALGILVRGTNVFPLNGTIAEAAVWTIALSDAEMLMLALGVSPRRVQPQSLAAYWSLRGDASPEIDLLAGHANLTVTGATASAHPRIVQPWTPTLVTKPGAAAAGQQGRMFLLFP